MSRPRGFDPLSSLFDAPDPTFLPTASPPADEEEETSAPLSHLAQPVVDPSYVPPPAAELPVPPRSEAPRVEPRIDVAPVAPRSEAPVPEPSPAAAVDREAIARALAKAAAARVREAPKAEAAPTPPAPAAPPASAAPPAPVAEPAPPRRSAASPARGARRLEDIAPRPSRPRDALSAARAAAEAEAASPPVRPAASAPAAPASLEARVGAVLQQSLPSLGSLAVHRALVADDRGVLRPLWRAHRAKALADGALDRAVGAVAVLQALDSVPANALVAAHVLTEASDYLVWLDLSSGALVAAFSDARAWYGGGR